MNRLLTAAFRIDADRAAAKRSDPVTSRVSTCRPADGGKRRVRDMRRSIIGTVISILVFSSSAGPASAGPPRFNPPKSYYLALGDSVTYGYQASKVVPGFTAEEFDTGYVDVFAAQLRHIQPSIRVVNYGCPGESSTTFISGRCPIVQTGFPLHDPFSGPQLDAAIAFLRSHPGEVSPITITLWGNDVRELLVACGPDLSCVMSGAPATIDRLASNLDSILRRLRAAAPNAEIVVTGAWDSFVGDFTVADPLFIAMNAAMADVVARHGGRFADVFPVFNPQGDEAAEIAAICTFLLICTEGDSHPSDAGYGVLGEAVFDASGYARLLEG
jgi:lysophospholipase L1-like esterase